ncbi:RagB/SusD family nutrient uptake outer membrane protein [Dysgonomonas termitidis]|uniref:RagB/SusD family nutrient uptake outer membrane protein n=1 Tax=Dysgonomonas termitidis TaxID=1516126 RepID=A0ABV9L3M6_9BACT
MKKYKLIFALSALLFATSCADSFFDLEPSDKVTADKIYKTASDYNLAVIGCYGKYQEHFSYYLECVEFRSDNAQYTAPTTGQQDRYDIDQFKENSANGTLQSVWGIFSNGVYRCNLILDQIDDADFDATLKDQYKAEAMFLRAYNYFNMYRLWGGVPTTRKVVTVSESLTILRSTDQEMYDYIAGDLKYIIDNNMLPEAYSKDDLGRATLGAARALLGKVYLTFRKWAETKDVLEPVIGKYSLLKNPADIFDVNNKMNNEIIFAIRFNKSIVSEGHGLWFQTSATSNDYQTPQLLAAYTDQADLRKDLITLTKSGNAYVPMKYYDTPDATYPTQYGNDFILLRYADVLLMYAEALNEISYSNSQTSPAMAAITEVRERAELNALDIATIPNKDAFRKAILEERQREFPFEGHRWFDLVRMGYAKEIMAAVGHTVNDYQLVYPIPQKEIEKIGNKSILWQNEGY